MALALLVAVLVGMGVAALWERGARRPLAVVVMGTAAWSYVLLSRGAGWNPWLGIAVVVAGPAGGGGGRRRGGGLPGGAGGVRGGHAPHRGDPDGRAGGGGFRPPGRAVVPSGRSGFPRRGWAARRRRSERELTALLKVGGSACTWAAAAVGSSNAAGYQLATGLPVMAVGGFNGTGPAPTLERFQRHVAEGKIRYHLGTGMGGFDDAARIASRVQESFTATTVGGVTVFDLTRR